MKTKRLLLSIITLLVAAVSWADVAINETNFPDENFRNWLKSQSYGSDGVLTDAEIAGVTSIEVSKKSIKSLQGIEFFTALEQLECDYNQITSLDVSKNTMLKILECSSNKLTALDVSKNKALAWLICYRVQLTALDLSKNTALIGLACGGNQLTTLDVSANTALTSLNCSSNKLTSLDVSKNTALTWIDCSSNQIKGTAMDALIASLPSVSSGTMRVIYDDYERNVINTTQLAAARAKGWKPYYYESYKWLEYAVSEPVIEGIAINETNFPDENFRSWLKSLSYGSDGVLTDAEIAGVTSIDVSSKAINSLQGIEFFTALRCLYCSFNQLITLDVSKNTALTELYCYNNQLTTLDVSKNTALTLLSCYYNQLTALDVSKNTALRTLNCYVNQLTSLDVSKNNTALTWIDCSSNQIKRPAMDALVESLPTVSSGTMDVIYNENEGNVMTTTQVAAAKAKGWTPRYYYGSSWQEYAGSEPVTEGIAINETNFPDENFRSWLKSLSYGSDGVLTDAEIAGVTSISIPSKSIKSLQGIEFFTALTVLYCDNNQLTTLDVSKNMALTSLSCGINQLTALDVSKNTALTELSCFSNQLTALDVSGCTALTDLYCYNNQLTALDVSGCTALTILSCFSNQLTALDVSGCTALTELYCFSNQLTALDVSKNTALERLSCYGNQIKGAAMDALVASLPTISSGIMDVIYNENEGNVITTTQVAAAKAKGWTPRYYDGSSWQKYAGSEPVVLKCATPIFAYFGGKMILRCATEGVKYACSLGFETNENLKLPSKVKISIYATKDGYEPSDTLTQVIDPRLLLGKVGDVNGDGEIGMPDVMYIVNYILNGKFPEEDDEEKAFTSCPDDNHPHMIDLGLPSGTKWACCNVGASAPEGYGDYFAWGETSTKSTYSWETYKWGSSSDNIDDIGSDIAGTSYDAATANWGAPWRMPNLTQIKELLDNCTSVWTTENGVNGRKFTGANGGTVFLPAAGDRWDSSIGTVNSVGHYWSSTFNEYDSSLANYLIFFPDGASRDSLNRCGGQSVRPVR